MRGPAQHAAAPRWQSLPRNIVKSLVSASNCRYHNHNHHNQSIFDDTNAPSAA